MHDAKAPFDITQIDREIEEALHASHDSRTTPIFGAKIRRRIAVQDSGALEPPEADPPEMAPQAGSEDADQALDDPINPSHYRRHPSGIECIEVTRHMNFNVGNAIKYLWRYLDKGDPVENLKKAQWYIDDEIRRLTGLR